MQLKRVCVNKLTHQASNRNKIKAQIDHLSHCELWSSQVKELWSLCALVLLLSSRCYTTGTDEPVQLQEDFSDSCAEGPESKTEDLFQI